MKAFLLLLLLAAPLLPAAEFPAALTVHDDGSFAVGGQTFFAIHFNGVWAPTRQTAGSVTLEPGQPRRSAGLFETAGEFKVYGGSFRLSEQLRAVSAGAVDFRLALESAVPLATNTLACSTLLPGETYFGREIRIDGQPFRLPEKFGGRVVLNREIASIELPVQGDRVTVSGKFGLLIQDNREFNMNSFDIRIYLVPVSQTLVGRAELNCRIAVDGVRSVPLGLMKTAPSDFSEGTRAPYRPAPSRFAGIDFLPVTPVAADGEIVLPEKATGNMLYLLHFMGDSGEKAGTIEATFADGSKQLIPVRRGIDADHWRNVGPLPNGAVVWSANGDDFYAGLLMSGFRLDRGDPAVIRFLPAKGAAWCVAAATLASEAVDITKIACKYYPVPGGDWSPLEAYHWIRKDSFLDFSGFTEKPAGKFGRPVPGADGYFTASGDPSKRIRFFGVNLCFSANFPERELADKLADELARMGYNAVRFHHFEQMLADPAGKSSLDFDPAQQDKLDYLFAACKARGMYVTLDLYCNRRLRPGELADYDGNEQHFMKALTPLMDSAFENWKAYAAKFLTRRNPYTGLTRAEDPALFCVNLLNENSLIIEWNASPRLTAIYEKAFGEWRKNNDPGKVSRDALFRRFLVEKQSDCIRRMTAFLRNELKLEAAVTDVNWQNFMHLTPVRENLDVVDNHMYWDHPSFPGEAWKLPSAYQQWSSTALMAENPRRMMPTRIFGKPFIVTEYQFCTPNRYRAEGGPLMGAYAALQDWDGLFRFAWAHNKDYLMKPYTNAGFDIVQDPVNRLAERIIFFLFRRGDVSPSKEAFALPVTPAMVDAEDQNFPAGFEYLGLRSRIGTVSSGRVPAGVKLLSPQTLPDIGREKAVSSTDEIEIDSSLFFRVVTPKSECLILKEGESAGKRLHVKDADTFQALALCSLDDREIGESSRLLLFQLTDVKNTIGRFSTPEMKLVEYWGELPQMVRNGRAQLEISLPPGGWRVSALHLDGSVKKAIPARYSDGILSFSANTADSMVYAITR